MQGQEVDVSRSFPTFGANISAYSGGCSGGNGTPALNLLRWPDR